MFDLIFASTLFLLAVLAFIKGFMSSFFSTFNWIVALFLSYFLSPIIIKFFGFGVNSIFITSLASIVTFFISWISISIITSSISKTFLAIIPDPIDKSMGFAFGFAKGYIIFAFLFALITSLYAGNYSFFSFSAVENDKKEDGDKRHGPQWLTKSKSYKILDLGSVALAPIALNFVDFVKGNNFSQNTLSDLIDKKITEKDLEEKIEDVNIEDNLEKVRKIHKIYQEVDNYSEKGYKKDEIENMDRLIETIE